MPFLASSFILKIPCNVSLQVEILVVELFSNATPTTVNIDVPPNAIFNPVNLNSIGKIAITARKNPPKPCYF